MYIMYYIEAASVISKCALLAIFSIRGVKVGEMRGRCLTYFWRHTFRALAPHLKFITPFFVELPSALSSLNII